MLPLLIDSLLKVKNSNESSVVNFYDKTMKFV